MEQSEGNQNEALIQPQLVILVKLNRGTDKPHPLLDVDLALVNVLSIWKIDELKAANLFFLYKSSDAFEPLRSKIYELYSFKVTSRQRENEYQSRQFANTITMDDAEKPNFALEKGTVIKDLDYSFALVVLIEKILAEDSRARRILTL
ncbi:hypothetical protein Ocin01_12144 [Orchesella cincta]|uniref:Uncharacterized protein n=1 Tax=Orchesella cincta TaxID=48709 RepID=A0A1D2MNF5_ORCCI|nr:hypothetical protein Ocin01_12144 [Orchesella cincta]